MKKDIRGKVVRKNTFGSQWWGKTKSTLEKDNFFVKGKDRRKERRSCCEWDYFGKSRGKLCV